MMNNDMNTGWTPEGYKVPWSKRDTDGSEAAGMKVATKQAELQNLLRQLYQAEAAVGDRFYYRDLLKARRNVFI
jgi:hypothetical protein